MTIAEPHALILAAGVGRRLGGRAEPMPKALLRFGGRSLLDRHLDALKECGVNDVTIVVGFEADQIRAATAGRPGVTLVHNPHYREGSLVSLAAAGTALGAARPLVLMDADVLYEARLLRRLLDSAHPNAFLLDREIEPGDEPVKLCIRGGEIVDFRKKPTADYEWYGESVGFFRFTPDTAAELARRCDDYLARGQRDTEYEEAIRDMVQADPSRFGWEEISGMPWTEIDFPEDVVKANSLTEQLVA